MARLTLRAGNKGCYLADEQGYRVASMSWMDAAHLLFNLKDELRKSRIGRGCVDDVAAKRTGNPSTRQPS